MARRTTVGITWLAWSATIGALNEINEMDLASLYCGCLSSAWEDARRDDGMLKDVPSSCAREHAMG